MNRYKNILVQAAVKVPCKAMHTCFVLHRPLQSLILSVRIITRHGGFRMREREHLRWFRQFILIVQSDYIWHFKRIRCWSISALRFSNGVEQCLGWYRWHVRCIPCWDGNSIVLNYWTGFFSLKKLNKKKTLLVLFNFIFHSFFFLNGVVWRYHARGQTWLILQTKIEYLS